MRVRAADVRAARFERLERTSVGVSTHRVCGEGAQGGVCRRAGSDDSNYPQVAKVRTGVMITAPQATRSAALFAVGVGVVVACGSQPGGTTDAGTYGSCTFIYNDAAVLCTDFAGEGWADGIAQQFCGDAQAYSSSPCPTANETVSCWFDQDGAIAEQKHCYVPDCTQCLDAGGD